VTAFFQSNKDLCVIISVSFLTCHCEGDVCLRFGTQEQAAGAKQFLPSFVFSKERQKFGFLCQRTPGKSAVSCVASDVLPTALAGPFTLRLLAGAPRPASPLPTGPAFSHVLENHHWKASCDFLFHE
jgi:hypothetical protein